MIKRLKQFIEKNKMYQKVIKKISDKDIGLVINAIHGTTLWEIKNGLGVEEDIDIFEDLNYFYPVDKIYHKSNRGCYFCDHHVDPNATPFTNKLCLDCRLKVENLLKFLRKGNNKR